MTTYTYPGVYIVEVPSGVRTIVGVSTSTTAFIGKAIKGEVNKPIMIHNFGDYERIFGGLWTESTMSFAAQQYFLNGGSEAIIVRVTRGTGVVAQTTTFTLIGPGGNLTLLASSPGAWGDNLRISVDNKTRDPSTLFNITVSDATPIGTGEIETLRNLSVNPASATFVTTVLAQQSKFVRVQGAVPNQMPTAGGPFIPTANGDDGGDISDADLVPASPAGKKGMYALEDADIFNLLCLPPLTFAQNVNPATYVAAAVYCGTRRALLLVDPPSTSIDPATAITDLTTLSLPDKNAALFFPRVKFTNSLKNNLLEEFVPCGAVAGIFARTDSQRGVWKAPAGLDATLTGVRGLTYNLTDSENGDLNPLGINCLRTFPLFGSVVWGSRTLNGADAMASEWKYIPVRRTALFLEESLYRGTQWVVFEPNDEPLWSQIRLNLTAFMMSLFRQGAFQGTKPSDAFFVKCDKETTTQDDINKGIVNILVAFAPLKPAEFVVIKLSQIAGQVV